MLMPVRLTTVLIKPFLISWLMEPLQGIDMNAPAIIRIDKLRNKRFEDLANNSPTIIWMSDKSGLTIFINKRWMEITGQPVNDALGYGWLEMVHPDDREEMGSTFLKAKEAEHVFFGKYRLKQADGDYRWVSDTGSPRIDNDGNYLGYIGGVIDIHDGKTAQEALFLSNERFEAAIEAIEGVMWISDAHGNFIDKQSDWENLTGQTFEEYRGLGWAKHVHPDDIDLFLATAYQSISSGESLNAEHRLKNKEGEYRNYSVRANAVKNNDGTIREWVGVHTDITEIRRNEARILHFATHDSLTNLPNRTLLEDHIRHLILQRDSAVHAILIMDMNRFKVINDTLGHAVGDQTLIEVGNLLSAQIGEGDSIARVGGDEFAIVLQNVKTQDNASKMGSKILDFLSHPIVVGQHELILNASIGIAMYPENGADATTLLRHADLAMYKAKVMGGNALQFYDHGTFIKNEERFLLERDLRRALQNNEFFLNYQPKINTRTMEVEGVEALIRWQHPKLGLIPPNDFISLAEEIGLIRQIGEWVTLEAGAQLQKWRLEGITNLKIAINVSVVELLNPLFLQTLKKNIAEMSLDPHQFELEITESRLMENIQFYEVLLNDIKSLGFTLSIDDFGTGYSCLSYLKRLPIEILKIDKSFIQDITIDKDDAAIVSATISMAQKMGLAIIAEGVETKEQVEFLQENGCTGMQGYYFSKPLSAAKIPEFVKQFHHALAQ
jgi:diguanylate cyclase (GGDEF)-like protein/PAS domain S-box-containing protein